MTWLTGVRLPEGLSDFRLLDGEMYRSLAASFDGRTLLRFAVLKHCGPGVALEYEPADRLGGVTKYSLRSRLEFASRAFALATQKTFIILSAFFLFLGLVGISYSLYALVSFAWQDELQRGWVSTISIGSLVLFSTSLIFLVLGNMLRALRDFSGQPTGSPFEL
jgi:hypothetical protein